MIGQTEPKRKPLLLPDQFAGKTRRGAALVLMLGILVLLTVVTVALLNLAGVERASASLALSKAQANLLADGAADIAMARIADAIRSGSQLGRSWASEPGRITLFTIASGSGAISRETVDMFSALPGPDDAVTPNFRNVDLNEPNLAGEFPIAPPAPGETAATMKVGWINVLADPSQPASADNPIIGRIAFWVDDESCKVNINTADGTRKGNDGHYPDASGNLVPSASVADGYSFGFGTPPEISLEALPGMDRDAAHAVADTAWDQPYHSAEEIVRAEEADGSRPATHAMFEAMRFDITHHNSAPEFNFLGEPRIALGPHEFESTTAPRRTALLGATQPPTPAAGPVGADPQNLVADAAYPQTAQIPLPSYLPGLQDFRLASFFNWRRDQRFIDNSENHRTGQIISQYLAGINLRGVAFQWPVFAGADPAAYLGKYTRRQVDSITLQILDTSSRLAVLDRRWDLGRIGVIENGWLSGEPVIGTARSGRITEILAVGDIGEGDLFGFGSPQVWITLQFLTEVYYPTGFRGYPWHENFEDFTGDLHSYGQRQFGSGAGRYDWFGSPNYYDAPGLATSASDTQGRIVTSGPSKLGGWWMDNMLRAVAPDGTPAGVDFYGHNFNRADPDQARAAIDHPYTLRPDGTYGGSVNYTASPPGEIPRAVVEWVPRYIGNFRFPKNPGTFHRSNSRWRAIPRPVRPGISTVRIEGGLQIWNQEISVDKQMVDVVPFASALPRLLRDDATLPPDFLERVVPIRMTLSVGGGQQRFLVRVADPLVNRFPGDWDSVNDPSAADVTIDLAAIGTDATRAYRRGGAASNDPFFETGKATSVSEPTRNVDGRNPGYLPSGGGDPLSIWLPPQDPRIPKLARFPSVGGLFSIRTGLFPDPAVDTRPIGQQRGVPFRGLNFSPSTESSQATDGGTSYPDWAMLDLFYVPVILQKPYGPAVPGNPGPQPLRRLTYGGATIGKMNINNPRIPHPFGESIAGVSQTPPRRSALEALFLNLRPSRSYAANGDPVFETIGKPEAAALADAVDAYVRSNGAMLLAGEIANVPAVADYLYDFASQTSGPNRQASISRNDIVRDTVGVLTTRSNTFTIYVVAQTIRKIPGNTSYGQFQAGDRVSSEVRRSYLVERFVETGDDGVPGNAIQPVGTNPANGQPVPNTYTSTSPGGDPAGSRFHPTFSSYPLPHRWRILSQRDLSR